MYTPMRSRLFGVITLLVLLASAVLTTPALADGSAPPPTNTSTPSSNSLHLPSSTSLVVLNSSGHKVPLGSQQAAQAMQNGDPIWCPSSVLIPVAGASGCSPAAYNGNLATLVNAVQSGTWHPLLTNSTIWIKGGFDFSGSQISLNGLTLPIAIATLNNYSLTFKGGWAGSGSGVNPNNLSIFNGVGFSIGTWHNNVTLMNILDENAPINQDGIYIQSTKKITLTNVQVENGQEYGAFLDNSTGTGVSISKSDFIHNDGQLDSSYGLYVWSKGPISVSNTTVSDNLFNGAYLDNSAFATSAQNVVLSGTNTFDANSGYGLTVTSKGAISAGSLNANNNSGPGASLDNHLAATAQPVTMSGTSSFTGNSGYGLGVASQGAITLHNVTSDFNAGGSGATLENDYCLTCLAPIYITGTNWFAGNGVDGLLVYSRGVISVNNLNADSNITGYGAYLANNYTATVASAVHVTGTNWFLGNALNGLYVASDGAITLNNLNVNGNGGAGALDGLNAFNEGAASAQGITLTGVNTFNGNTRNGANIQAAGPVSLYNVTAIGNSGATGLTIENDFLGASHPQNVSLLGVNNLSSNLSDNLDVQTYGAIKIQNLTADFSATGNGANLYYNTLDVTGAVTLAGTNTFDSNSGFGLNIRSYGAVSINNLDASYNGNNSGAVIRNTAAASAPVTLTGHNTFLMNKVDGVDIFSNGAISVSYLTADSNGGGSGEYGAYINNNAAPALGVTLSGTNTFDFNYDMGLFVFSKGAITISNLNAIGNIHNDGVDLNNTSGTASVALTGFNTFNSNNGFGLYALSNGNISASNLTADCNGYSGTCMTASSGDGVFLYNAIGSGSVTLSGHNTFLSNSGYGLDIFSKGNIVTSNLTANLNGSGGVDEIGVNLENQAGSGSVLLSGTNTFNYNYSDGLDILSNGAITTYNLKATCNGYQLDCITSTTSANGVLISNNISTAHPVYLKGFNTFLDNSEDGVDVFSLGAIAASNLTASRNGYDGGSFVNGLPNATAGISLTGTNVFLSNGHDGLFLGSNGPVSMTHITANQNSHDGLRVSTASHVSVICGSFMINGVGGSGYGWETGIAVSSISLYGVDTAGNFSGDYYHADLAATLSISPTCPLP